MIASVESALGGTEEHGYASLRRLLEKLDHCRGMFYEAVKFGKKIFAIAPDMTERILSVQRQNEQTMNKGLDKLKGDIYSRISALEARSSTAG